MPKFPSRVYPFFLCLGPWLALSACISFGASDDAKSDDYEVARPSAPWQVADPGGSDIAYRSAADNSTLSVNSVCGQYQDLSLEELRENALSGVGVSKIESERARVVGGLPALTSEAEGVLDGNRFRLSITVLRGRQCVYDILYVAPAEAYAAHEAFYETFLGSFREVARK